MTTARVVVLGLFAVARVAIAQATVTGTVFDSLRANAPLAGASVVIVELSKYATTDARGRFRFDSVPGGQYALTFLHPSLDSIDVAAAIVPLMVPERGTVNVRLATPSSGVAYSRLCPGARDLATGLVLGRVHDVDDATPLAGAIVTAAWTEYALDGGTMRSRVVRANAVTNAAGVYVLCGLPSDVAPEVYALADGHGAGPVAVALGTQAVDHLNIAVSRTDTAARLTPEELVDTARINKVGDGGRSSVAGVVRAADGRPLPAAMVSVAGSGREARIDSAGRFRLVGIAAGTRTLEVRAIGLAPVTILVDLKSGASFDTVITLERRPQALAEVSVLGKTGTRADFSGFEDRRQHAIGHFLTAADIEKSASVSIPMILNRVPTLRLMGKWGIFMNGGHYASNLCIPSYFLDGILSDAASVGLLIQAADIRGVEVYTAGETIPAQFDRSGKNGCGSIVIWTRQP